jgi:translation initiation factor IF-3
VRLIGVDGEQIGIVPTTEALQRAQDQALDLVEVAPNSRPPVCRIMDYGKYKYEMSKKDRAAKKKQHSAQLKEMRYRPKIDEHDYQFKTNHVRSFLESGSKVRAYVMFRGREMAHVEFGRKILTRLAEEMSDIAHVDVDPNMEGNRMTMIMSPTSETIKKAAEQKAAEQKAKSEKQDKDAGAEDNAVGISESEDKSE